MLVPLHNPFHLAKQVATLQELSGGRFTLGVGMGWHRDEYDFMGVEFAGRGRRADRAIRVMRALWSGERSFEGRFWSFRDATAEPHPSPQPQIWGRRQLGACDPAGARARRRSGTRRAAPTPRTSAASRSSTPSCARSRACRRSSKSSRLLEAGADGAIVSFPDEAAMRRVARRYR